MIVEIRYRRDTAANWSADNPVLADGEPAIETDTAHTKVGDGVTAWNDLPYNDQGPQGPAGTPGTNGSNGAPGAPGGSDAATAGWITGGTLTPLAVQTLEKDWIDKNQHALRHFHVAAAGAGTTAVDIGWFPGDSVAEGAYATNYLKSGANVALNVIRKSLQPSGITGGTGYFGLGGTLILAQSPFFGASGTVTAQTSPGLGKKAVIITPGSSYIAILRNCSHYQIVYSTNTAAGGSFNTALGSPAGAPTTSVVTTAASVTRGNKSPVYTNNVPAAQYLTIANNGAVNITVEGIIEYNGDQTAGIRMWEGARAGYTAQQFMADTVWADSIPMIPNLRLAIIGIGSNDWYSGQTVAATKTRIQSIISLIRSKSPGTSISFVLASYYDRSALPNASVAPWSDFQQMYREIAAADEDVALIDYDPLFGVQTSATDDRDGLMVSDYVHPSDAGFVRIGGAVGQFVIPGGTESLAVSAQAAYDPTTAPVSTPQATAIHAASAGLPYIAVGNFAGAAAFQATPIANYSLTATGNVSIALSGMPPVTAGRTGEWFLAFTQDGTGGRSLTLDAAIKTVGTFAVDSPAAAITLVRFFYDGARWWAENVGNPALSSTQTTLVAANAGDQQAAYSAAFPGGAITLSAFAAGVYGVYRLVLGGNVTFSALAKPVIAAGRAYSFKMVLVQDATGSRTITWNANVLASGTKPVLSTAPNSIDVIEFLWTGTELIIVDFIKGAA